MCATHLPLWFSTFFTITKSALAGNFGDFMSWITPPSVLGNLISFRSSATCLFKLNTNYSLFTRASNNDDESRIYCSFTFPFIHCLLIENKGFVSDVKTLKHWSTQCIGFISILVSVGCVSQRQAHIQTSHYVPPWYHDRAPEQPQRASSVLVPRSAV